MRLPKGNVFSHRQCTWEDFQSPGLVEGTRKGEGDTQRPGTTKACCGLWGNGKKRRLHWRLMGAGSTEDVGPSNRAGTPLIFRKAIAPASMVEPEQGVWWGVGGECSICCLSFLPFNALHRLSLLEGWIQSSLKGSLPGASSWASNIMQRMGNGVGVGLHGKWGSIIVIFLSMKRNCQWDCLGCLNS